VVDIGLPLLNVFVVARAAGFDAFFAKPADIPALLDALHRLSAAGQT
jgi:CheY-like chemotaxis protein